MIPKDHKVQIHAQRTMPSVQVSKLLQNDTQLARVSLPNINKTVCSLEKPYMYMYTSTQTTILFNVCKINIQSTLDISESKIHFDCFLQPQFGVGDFFTSPNYPKCKFLITLKNHACILVCKLCLLNLRPFLPSCWLIGRH